ncbi:hypothetical protein PMAYCL1PPCAC_06624 [Pristionchus mayeri]|uniref:Histone acetyltransferase n=1 Tax=Pristionchus mayeri TaxID=1317129 RepID=A0AAN4ZAK6_9BILA|nr:hypothetical protein PMAYCL1PPCAC_06624 [Pristionchus mayeri]
MKSSRPTVVSPTRSNDGGPKKGRKRITSVGNNEVTPKAEKKELRGSPTKEAKTTQRKSEEVLKKVKGAKGRPIGWRKEMKGMGYLVYSGLKKGTSMNASKKIERRIVNNIKKKYNREVTPCPAEEIKGVGARKKGSKSSPMKTRALQKKSEKEEKSLVARCVLCRSKEGELHPCAECNALYHLRKCCRYSEETASEMEGGGRKRWLCARCTACAHCNEYISDPHNVECKRCAVTFHGKCAAKGGKMIGGSFTCEGCIKQMKSPQKGDKELKKDEEKIWKRGRKPKTPTTTPKGWAFIVPENEIEEEKRRIDERDALYDQLMEQITRGKNGNANSPSKYGIISSSPLKMKKVALQSDIDLFEAAKKALAVERDREEEGERGGTSAESSPTSSHSSLDNRHQWIYVGSKKDKMKSIYSSPYPQEIAESPNVYICPFCLRANDDEETFRIHQLECTWNCPPGNEIYRDTEGKFSFFEVDGAEQKLYCRRVCLVGKLFISSKTLVDEVETFLFYVLVEHTNEGCEFVGYFSKEKNPSKNNNLSCILTLPSAMRSGYGRLLIDLSYELSRIERKIGSPEHPLSDLGLIAYKGFWRSSILCYLRSLRGTHVASVKQISLATRIAPQDVINQLMRDGLLFYKDGVYFVNTEQRAYRIPLAMTRRKTIDHSKLKWEPADGSHEHLDSTRLNYYV